MSFVSDQPYFARRAVEELERGDLATDAQVARVHFESAMRYSLLAQEVDGDSPKVVALHDYRRRAVA